MTTRHLATIRHSTIAALLLLALVIIIVIPRLLNSPAPTDERGEPVFAFRETSFDALAGWQAADFNAALETFGRSCSAISARPPTDRANPIEALGANASVQLFAGLVSDWQSPCGQARALIKTNASDPASSPIRRMQAAQTFFERSFVPVQILNFYPDDPRAGDQTQGLFTGYFEPVYDASRVRTEQFSEPVYARPDDLVDIDLGAFRPDLAGTRLAGRINSQAGGLRLAPFESRAEIYQGALAQTVPILAWLDPDDAFFLQIQGSGTLQFSAQDMMRVGYAGQNGHPYTAIGKSLVQRGAMTLEEVSLESILRWLRNADPAEAQALREENASYVFFTVLDNLPDPQLGPLGAQGVQLTPIHSLALDRRYHAMGTPVWLDMESPFRGRVLPYRQLMIAQDTGGAIRGPVRGDVFWGRGDDAAGIAGIMRSRGIMVVLIPRAAAARWSEAGS